MSTKIPDAIDSSRESSKEFGGSIFELVYGWTTTFSRRDGMAGLVDGRCLRSVSPLNDVGRRRVYSHARDRSPPEGEELLAFSLGWLGAPGLIGGSGHERLSRIKKKRKGKKKKGVTSGTWRVEDLPTNLPTLCHPSSPSLAFSSSGGSLVFYSQGRVSRVMLQTGRFPKIPSRFTPNSDPIILSSIACHAVLPASQPATTRHAYNRTRLSYSNYARS